MKKVIALVLALCMVLTLGLAFAEGTPTTYQANEHDVTITTNGESTHEYSVFQIFKGDLDATEHKLSNIIWGLDFPEAKVNALKTAVAADSTLASAFSGKNTAQQFAEVLGAHVNDAAFAKAFADAVNTALGDAKTQRKASTSNGSATIRVPNDGYYFIKDTGTIGDNDTKTRFMLQVLDDLSVTAKDTHITPNKEIVSPNPAASKKQNDANIGDTINYKVTIPIPDTKLYKDHFVFVMNDQLEEGLTFAGINSITVGGQTLVADTNYELTVSPEIPEGTTDLVTATGGQTITVKFIDFKTFVETPDPDLTGNVVIDYNAVLNQDATFGVDSNDNTVYFDYSNDPNYKYEGDNPGPAEVMGKTPIDTTKTYSTSLKVLKVDENGVALPGAVFEIKGNHGNKVVETGDKYILGTYTPEANSGETVIDGTYYLLKDGTYTATAPVTDGTNADTSAQYQSTTDTYTRVHYHYVSDVGDSFTVQRTSDANGIIELDGLRDGEFTVQEIAAPDGYNVDNTLYTLKILWTEPTKDTSKAIKATGGFTKGSDSSTQFTETQDGALFSISITNKKGTQLPSTGGIGTTIFYILGGLLVVGAAVILVARRKAQD